MHRPAMLPVGLAGPVDVALARAEETVPGPHALPGGSVYELKFDGYRGAFVRNAAGGRLWSRNRNDLSDRFPEIVAAFRTLGLGDPQHFYDAVITAGYPLRRGEVGTLGELSPKPHPWLYAEALRVGLGIPFEDRGSVIGVEDSGAGVCALRLAGVTTIGLAGGNVVESGTRALCHHFCSSLDEVLAILD